MKSPFYNYKQKLPYDLSAGLVVFLVALPLCLGIALASGAPLFSGIIAGIVGGLVVSLLSGSHLSVSGPAAGLTAIVLAGIAKLETFEAFLAAVVCSGIIQLILGFLRAGTIANFAPNSVIKGMLASIGLLLILKQLPHAFGYDVEQFGLESFQISGDENTFTALWHALLSYTPGALLISLVSFLLLLLWERPFFKKMIYFPGPLAVVLAAIAIQVLLMNYFPATALTPDHLVQLPVLNHPAEFIDNFRFPDWGVLNNPKFYQVAFTLAIVASLESLLSVEAVDKLDPLRRETNVNRELKAQGVGNAISGLIGGLPVTAVIVRSSANVNAGAQTRLSAFYHGIFLLAAVLFISRVLNLIPLASLSVILIFTGYKLARVKIFKDVYRLGWNHFIPFVMTIIAVLFTDLLTGIIIGILIGLFFVLRSNFKTALLMQRTGEYEYVIRFNHSVTFMNKVILAKMFKQVPEDSTLLLDVSDSDFIDMDIQEMIDNFQRGAEARNIRVEIIGETIVPEM